MSDPRPAPTGAPRLPMPKLASLRVLISLIQREMSTSYGASPGGYIWAILSPLGTTAVMAMAFSLIVRTPPLGTSFLVFYAAGVMPFNMFNQLTAKISNSVSYSKPLLAYSRVTWIDSVLARFILNILTQLVIFALVMTIILSFVDAHTMIRPGPLFAGIAIMAMLGLGLGLINCLMIGYLPVWGELWGILSRPMFLVSGIFFLVEDLPPKVRNIIEWFPMAQGVAMVRSGFYPTYDPQFVSLSYCFGISFGMILFGLLFMRRGYLAGLER